MKILLFYQTTDSDLKKGLKVCYKDINGEFTKLGIITEISTINQVKNYSLDTSIGSYSAEDLKLIDTKNIRYVITAIKKSGLREMAFDNNSRNTYETKEEAAQKIKDIIKANSREQIKQLIGTKLRVTKTECYLGGDSKRTIFPLVKK